MAHKKNLGLSPELHFAFQTALGMESYDPEARITTDAFMAQYETCPYPTVEDARNTFRAMTVSHLLPMRLVERIADGGRYRATQKAHDWAQVFQLGPDRTSLLFGQPVEDETWSTFMEALRKFRDALDQLIAELRQYLDGPHSTPVRLQQLVAAANTLMVLPRFPDKTHDVDVYRETIVLACREQMLWLRKRTETLELLARDRHVITGTTLEYEQLKSMLDLPALCSALDTRKPRLTDFVNVGIIEDATHDRPTDEKFGILTAPSKFLDDFKETADGAFSRGRSFAVGFIDIDKFKSFNDKHDEVLVDRVVLPQFMRGLEAYCHRRAYAYRQGGDEYLVLLHNANASEAKAFFEGLQEYIATIDYPDSVKRKPTVSIGVHVIDDKHEVTEFEAKKRANEAKKIAKDSGRNCVRFSTDPPVPELRKVRQGPRRFQNRRRYR